MITIIMDNKTQNKKGARIIKRQNIAPMKIDFSSNRLFFLFLFFGSFIAHGQINLDLDGPILVNVGSTWTYTVTTTPPGSGNDYTWEGNHNGTIISETRTTIRIQWNQIGFQEIDGYWDNGPGYQTFLEVAVIDPSSPAKPAAPIRTADPCGPAIVKRAVNSYVPFGETWYWQTSSSGQSTSASGSQYTVNSSGQVYLRSRNNYTNLWGPSSDPLTVTIIPFPSDPTYSINPQCDVTTLTMGTIPSNEPDVTWYWQSDPNGFNTANSNSAIDRTTGTVYYLRAKSDLADCWSQIVTINYAIKQTPELPEANGDAICGGPETRMLTAIPAVNTIARWYTTASGGIPVESNEFTTPMLSGTASFYVSSYSPASGGLPACESARVEVVVTVASSIPYYEDKDHDGSYGSITMACASPTPIENYTTQVLEFEDCDDDNSALNSATEWYVDIDGDGNAASIEVGCLAPTGGTLDVLPLGDCDDNDPDINVETIWYLDDDDDGLGDFQNKSTARCIAPDGYVLNFSDLCPNIGSSTNDCTPTEVQDFNYVYKRSYQNESPTVIDPTFFTNNENLIQQVTYFDGLGRPVQGVGIDQSPNETGNYKDIITYIEYDEYGRQKKEYLPYVFGEENTTIVGEYQSTAKSATLLHYFNDRYENTLNPYSQKDLEASPLNRVLKQAAPGNDWALGSGHEIEFDYLVNATGEVRLFGVDFINDDIENPQLTENGFYTVNELYKNLTKDENHDGSSSKLHTTEEFTDKQGRVILKRTYGPFDSDDNGTIGANEEELPFDTYYVYDDYGNLTYVLPPKMDASDTANTIAILQGNLAELGYQYIYDDRNRLVEKQIPGKEKEYIVYNKLDQPILTQDANQRDTGTDPHEWLFTKYDAFGRVAYAGKATSVTSVTRTDVQDQVNTLTNTLWATQNTSSTNLGGVDIFYDNSAYLGSGITGLKVTLTEILTINYYDDYVDLPTGAPGTVTLLGTTNVSNAANVKGLSTSSKVKVLDANPVKWINTVSYYDAKARPIYSYSKNDYLETTDIMETQLDFVGKPLKVRTSHIRSTTTIVTIDNFTYDHVGRLLAQTQCIGDETMGDTCGGVDLPISNITVTTPQMATNSITVTPTTTLLPGAHLYIEGVGELIVYNDYDDLGQLKAKKVGGTPGSDYNSAQDLQTVDYTYNVRGWLTDINDITDVTPDKLFNFGLSYNQGPDPLYNGNISRTEWRSDNQDKNLKSYAYSYDPLNRITAATGGTGNTDYDIAGIDYDKNGNIQHLNRKGHTDVGATTFGDMDNLTYTYDNGNKLLSVTDAINTPALMKGEFKDGNKDGNDYRYDFNGNMVMDKNKGIGTDVVNGITYNHLNLPVTVTVDNGADIGTIQYVYDATGVKLKKIASGTSSGTTEYAGNYIYENDKLQMFNTSEGYVLPKDVDDYSVGFDYVYNYTDHLGNIRLSYTDADGNGSINPTNEIVEENNYYPFGLKHKGYNNNISPLGNSVAKKFKYNGQEFEESLGLNLYEMEFRQYDPAIARWTSIDPVIHFSNSTYNAFDNSPIYWSDPSGADAESFVMDLFDRSSNGESWTNNNDGTFSSSRGQSADCDDCSSYYLNLKTGRVGSESGDRDLTSQGKFWVGGSDASVGEIEDMLSLLGFKYTMDGGLRADTTEAYNAFIQMHNGEVVQLTKSLVIEYGAVYIGNIFFPTGGGASAGTVSSKGISALGYASRFGIKSYKELIKLTKGKGLQVHHLIEQRFAGIMKVIPGSMESIALTKFEHQVFTNAWRSKIGYAGSKSAISTATASRQQVLNAAKEIYKDYPTILKALGL